MKTVKIILVGAVIAIISFFILNWFDVIDKPKEITPPINQFTTRIHHEIDSLKQAPANIFSQKFYEDIQYLINDYHQKDFLSKSENDNNQWRAILSKNLYSAYAPKFVEQALYVFSRSEWKNDDLQFIRSEVNDLTQSSYLDPKSPVANSFSNIKAILEKYDEISSFISGCNNFSYNNYKIEHSFPDVTNKIQKARTYLLNDLDNDFVNNCIRLKRGLREIPENLFNKHLSYLQKKIRTHAEKYAEYNFQADYSKAIYTPLKNQIEELSREVYGVNDHVFDSGYGSLENLLSAYNRTATDYFFKIIEEFDEIKRFIASCNAYEYSNSDINSSFPDVSEKIKKSRAYLTKESINPILNNSNEDKDALIKIPKVFFDKHISFLRKKINENGVKYTEFKYQSEYSKTIYRPLKNHIEHLNNSIYGVNENVFNNSYSSLDELLRKLNDEANIYYSNPNKKNKKKK